MTQVRKAHGPCSFRHYIGHRSFLHRCRVFLVAGFISYFVICLISGAFHAFKYRKEASSTFSEVLFKQILLFPPTGLGHLRRHRDERRGHRPLLLPIGTPRSRCTVSMRSRCWSLVSLSFIGSISFDSGSGRNDIVGLYSDMAKGLSSGRLLFLSLFKLFLLCVAYFFLVMLPKNRATMIERDFWRDPR